jgi:hypothetical protein
MVAVRISKKHVWFSRYKISTFAEESYTVCIYSETGTSKSLSRAAICEFMEGFSLEIAAADGDCQNCPACFH